MNILSLDWYIQPPIDFEHKQYVLFSYLQKVDNSFLLKNLSPHLLHLEKIVNELNRYNNSYESMRNTFNSNRYTYFNENPKLTGENNELILEIEEIVSFSIPQIKTRIDLGYTLLKKYKQILY